MLLKVKFRTQTGHEIIEWFDSEKGSTCDYNLRALALGWVVIEVAEVDRE